jgi:hypothetical protein
MYWSISGRKSGAVYAVYWYARPEPYAASATTINSSAKNLAQTVPKRVGLTIAGAATRNARASARLVDASLRNDMATLGLRAQLREN